jgi:uncharacterized protein (DUF736 family)
MPVIGHFTRNPDGSLIGEIITLSVQARNVRIVPEETVVDPASPTHRIMVGLAHIGAAWPCGEGGPLLRLTLDDPSFAASIDADLIEAPEGTYSLIWNRPRNPGG